MKKGSILLMLLLVVYSKVNIVGETNDKIMDFLNVKKHKMELFLKDIKRMNSKPSEHDMKLYNEIKEYIVLLG